jgi:hypothetical protein
MAMVSLKLDATGDLSQDDSGALEWVTGADAVKQLLQCRLRLFLGEWFGDLTAGVPQYQQILDTPPRADGTSQPPSSRVVEAALRKVILGTLYVEAITAFSMDFSPQTRTLSVTFTATTSEGVVDISEVFPI